MVLRGTKGGKCYRLLPEKENTAVSEYDWSIWLAIFHFTAH